MANDETLLAPLVGRDMRWSNWILLENLSADSAAISDTIVIFSELNPDLGDKTEATSCCCWGYNTKIGDGHKLDMVYGCKVFDIKPDRDIFAEFCCPTRAIGSLQHGFGLHDRKWVDTEQVWPAQKLFDEMASPFGHYYETKTDFIATIFPATNSTSEFVPITGHTDTYL
ncbi:hypothetical protein K7X08_008631 [Anisodus acutangulus]|uniref:Uncharacterized protein n=1 Tax=Anisodus acutangulus TaxID=402998 RepID=A0A9Q1RQ23_9SOLA|nr:hypothetical protein K7X08_008631 [Anisodus acutangulus]